MKKTGLILLFLASLTAFSGCMLLTGLPFSSRTVVYDYVAEKETACMKTPDEPGFYREIVIDARRGCDTFFTAQPLLLEGDSSDKAFILRERELNGKELSKEVIRSNLYLTYGYFSFSPDRTVIVYHASDPGRTRSIYRFDLKNEYREPKKILEGWSFASATTSCVWLSDSDLLCLFYDAKAANYRHRLVYFNLITRETQALPYELSNNADVLAGSEEHRLAAVLTKRDEIVILDCDLNELWKIPAPIPCYTISSNLCIKWGLGTTFCVWDKYTGEWCLYDAAARALLRSGRIGIDDPIVCDYLPGDCFVVRSKSRNDLYNAATGAKKRIPNSYGPIHETIPGKLLIHQ